MKKTTLGHQSYPKSIARSSHLKNSVVKLLKVVVISNIRRSVVKKVGFLRTEKCSEQNEKGLALWDKTS